MRLHVLLVVLVAWVIGLAFPVPTTPVQAANEAVIARVVAQQAWRIWGDGQHNGFPGIRDEICRQHEVEVVGELPSLREHFYAISAERRLKHPAVVAISESAHRDLFA